MSDSVEHDTQYVLGGLVAACKEFREDLSRLDAEISAIKQVTAELAEYKPRAGEILFFGRRWGRRQWGALTILAGLLTSGAGVGVRHHLSDERRQMEQAERVEIRLDAIVIEVAVLLKFMEAGGRATDKQLLRVTRCVRERFRERLRAIDAGQHLAMPSPELIDLTQECFRDLTELTQELERNP